MSVPPKKSETETKPAPDEKHPASSGPESSGRSPSELPPETGGRGGLEPTRYGDWEVGGICSDF